MRCEGATVPLSAAGCADGPGRPASRACPFLLFPSLFSSPVSPPTRRSPAGEGSLPWLLSCPLCVPFFSLGLQKRRGGGWGAPGEEGKSAGSDARLRARPELRGHPGPRSVPPRCPGVARAGVASSSAQRRRGGACAMQDPRGHRESRGAAGPVSLCLRSLGSVRRAPRAPGEDNRCLLRHPGPTGGSPHARRRLCRQATLEHRREPGEGPPHCAGPACLAASSLPSSAGPVWPNIYGSNTSARLQEIFPQCGPGRARKL
ncbi:hypothetical protein H8958_012786 [Nasalis larvatus]